MEITAITWGSFFPSHTLKRPPRKSCQDIQGPRGLCKVSGRSVEGMVGLRAALLKDKTYSSTLSTFTFPRTPMPVFFIDLWNSCNLSKSFWRAPFTFYTLATQTVVCGPALASSLRACKKYKFFALTPGYSTRISPFLKKIAKWFVCTLKFEEHYFRLPAHDLTHFISILCGLVLSHILIWLFNASRCIS